MLAAARSTEACALVATRAGPRSGARAATPFSSTVPWRSTRSRRRTEPAGLASLLSPPLFLLTLAGPRASKIRSSVSCGGTSSSTCPKPWPRAWSRRCAPRVSRAGVCGFSRLGLGPRWTARSIWRWGVIIVAASPSPSTPADWKIGQKWYPAIREKDAVEHDAYDYWGTNTLAETCERRERSQLTSEDRPEHQREE